ncbi:nicotinate (nicotinamide) nucleotide adenylyltransferase [Candidatus Saccharibacteria bacterium]|nr:MAG: nicotinate (nicotinamide) nucleotide adenylyltransferase [Candidatus Saccharibacteria bacterium]
MIKRIGIFSGSFDPVHKGHIAFALEAAKTAKLDKVYFAPEIKPRRKPHVTHIAHRLAMLQLAVRSQPKLGVLELPDKYFLPKNTMARLRTKFPDDTLVLLLGSDLFGHLAEHSEQWPHVEYLLSEVELAVSVRTTETDQQIQDHRVGLPVQPKGFHIVHNHHPIVSSASIRQAVMTQQSVEGLLPSVAAYIRKHWLYHDVATANKKTLR